MEDDAGAPVTCCHLRAWDKGSRMHRVPSNTALPQRAHQPPWLPNLLHCLV